MIEALMNNKLINQFVTYFFVGGMAALVEWTSYFVFNQCVNVNYVASTILAFVIATFANWILGRKITFKDAEKNNTSKEILGIYIVSGVGLFCNLIFMYLFVQILGIYSLVAKITSTGIVFFWNFISRKLFVYKV